MKLSTVIVFVLSLFTFLVLLSDYSRISAGEHVRVAPLVTSEIEFPGKSPGKAVALLEKNRIILENSVISFQCSLTDKTIKPESLAFKQGKKKIEFRGRELFSLSIGSAPLPEITETGASRFVLKGQPVVIDLRGKADSVRLENRFNGKAITACFVCPKTGLNVEWKAVLTDNASFVRQEFFLVSPKQPVELREIVLLDFDDPTARISSETVGSPVICDSFFAAVEHPAATNAVENKRVRCSYPCGVVLRSPMKLEYSSVLGVWPEGQLRRSFLYYLERCRACPCHAFLHQNNGSQIGRIYYGHTSEKDKPAFRAGQAKL